MIGADFPGLLADARRGDADAFARLWRDANPALVRYLRGLLGTAGDDVASETWLAVMRGLGSFRGDERGFRAWLFTVARNKMIDAQRRDRSGALRPLEDGLHEQEPIVAGAADVAEERMSTERALALISTLPADQAEVILLRVVAGLDTVTVARLVGKSEGAVRVCAHRALRRLGERLGGVAVTHAGLAAFRSRDA